jgi:hypothetical protein
MQKRGEIENSKKREKYGHKVTKMAGGMVSEKCRSSRSEVEQADHIKHLMLNFSPGHQAVGVANGDK